MLEDGITVESRALQSAKSGKWFSAKESFKALSCIEMVEASSLSRRARRVLDFCRPSLASMQ